jgi:ubiquinone/menaquinone biosynthesis C-methylase UbiE
MKKKIFQKEYWERDSIDNRKKPTDEVIKTYVSSKIKEIRKIVNINNKTKILDVGSGNGYFSYYFEKIADTTGIDYSEKMIKLNPIKKKFVMDANNLKFKDNSFDVVFCHALLHHIENPINVLKEMQRVSKEYVIIIEPNRNNPFMFLFSYIVKEERKALKFSLKYLRKMMENLNIKIIKSFSYGLLVPNKTPKILLPLLKRLEFKQPLGMLNILIGIKSNY